MIKTLLNPKGHQNPISDLKVTAILLKGWILPIGGASAGEGLRLQPVQQACFFRYQYRTKTETSVCVFYFMIAARRGLKTWIPGRRGKAQASSGGGGSDGGS